MKKKTFATMPSAPVQARGILEQHDAETAAQAKAPKRGKRQGRPPIDPAERTTEKITLNLTKAEKAMATQKAGGRGTAAYLRQVLRDAGVFES